MTTESDFDPTSQQPLDADIDEVEALRGQIEQLKAQSLIERADLENQRKRLGRELEMARKFANERLLGDLLPVLDSLEAGLKIDNASAEQLREGTEATLRQLLSALERNKVAEVNPAAGAKFDPATQQAISIVPAPQQAPNTVVNVLQKGYTIADRVLRPALVTVTASN